MFETVGKNRKQDRSRQLSSIFLSFLVNTSFLGGLAYLGGQIVEEVMDEAPVEVTFFDEAPPPPPPPPPPPAGAEKQHEEKPEETEPEEEPEEEVEPDPEEIVECFELGEVCEADSDCCSGLCAESVCAEPSDEEPEEEAVAGGMVGGVEGGVEGGVVGGVVGGEIGGVLGGQLGGTGVNMVHWSDVKPKRRVNPKFPQAAKALNITEESCNVRFFIDEQGKPYDIKVEKCSNLFHENVLAAAWKWRFYPVKSENGTAVKSSFVLRIKFKLN